MLQSTKRSAHQNLNTRITDRETGLGSIRRRDSIRSPEIFRRLE